jgi:hypothetical protein
MAPQNEADIEVAKIVVGRDASDIKKFGTAGTLFIGKHLVGTGEEAHTTTPLLVDALRPHEILVCGKRGEGKCLAPYSEVLLPDGTKKGIDEIFKMAACEDADWTKNEELLPSIGNITVLSLDTKSLEIKPAVISHVYRKKVKENLLKLTTKRGKEIMCTKEHPLLVIEPNLTWRSAEELHKRIYHNEPPRATCDYNDTANYHNEPPRATVQIGAVQTSTQSDRGQLLKSYILSWDDIDKLEEVEYDGYVYDLTVPSTHNFIANGIVCHNSYSMGILAEEIRNTSQEVGKNLCVMMIDTQGIFWTMKSPNEKDLPLLSDWQLRPKGFDICVLVPEGQEDLFRKANVIFDGTFGFGADDLAIEDWISVFELDPAQPMGILLQQVMGKMKEKSRSYTLEDIMTEIKKQSGFETEKLALENCFEVAKGWGIFGTTHMPEILESNMIVIIDVSLTPQSVRALLVAIVCRKLFTERTVARRKEELAEAQGISIKRKPMPWILIDEAHNFVPNEGTPASLDTLLKITREGRQPGITLVLVTQQPEKLHPDALSQTDILIAHRLTSKGDMDALRRIMQTYLLFPIEKYMNELPRLKGACLILDDNSERIYSAQIRPRQSWHAGSSPVAI